MSEGNIIRRSRRFREAPKVDYNENNAFKKRKTNEKEIPKKQNPKKIVKTKVEESSEDEEYRYIYQETDSDSSIDEYEFEPAANPIKVVLGKRVIPPVNPGAVLKPPKFNHNPKDYLNSYKTFLDDIDTTEDEYQLLIEQKKTIFQQINKLKQNKRIILLQI